MITQVETLRDERAKIDAYCRTTLVPRLASAIAAQLPTASALARVYQARLAQLAALELAIASYDPQQGLFADWHAQTPEGRD